MMGASPGISTFLAPVYIAETAPKASRGIPVSFVVQTISGGIMLGYIAAGFPIFSFREHAYFGLLFPILGLLLAPLPSESPRWRMRKGREEEAARAVRRLIVIRARSRRRSAPFGSATKVRPTQAV